jgi:uncharacterized protein (TIGR01319 family)
MKPVDLLAAEIGSTTTVVTAIDGVQQQTAVIVGQGYAPTSVLEGDVTQGLYKAIANLEENIGQSVQWETMLGSSSAAGGLKMTVHGLVYDMTVKAAREAALGAGANIHWVSAGELTPKDMDCIEKIRPNIILLAGGVDYGEKDTVITNAKHLSRLPFLVPVVYAGNCIAGSEVFGILQEKGFQVTWVENVYPRIDQLNIEPTRRAIHDVFEKHITEAPGMHKVRELIKGKLIPTPGAVLSAAKLLRESIGDLMVVDVGGATTDVHSVTEGDPEIAVKLIAPEPLAKRTVEGDLGVYVNAENVLQLCDTENICKLVQCNRAELASLRVPIPVTQQQQRLVSCMTEMAVKTAVSRHAGKIEHLYGPNGRVTIARGKDLTKVKWIIGTGGALTRLDEGRKTLGKTNFLPNNLQLWPRHAEVLLDNHYIMAVAGLLADEYPQASLSLLNQSFFG